VARLSLPPRLVEPGAGNAGRGRQLPGGARPSRSRRAELDLDRGPSRGAGLLPLAPGLRAAAAADLGGGDARPAPPGRLTPRAARAAERSEPGSGSRRALPDGRRDRVPS